MINVSLGNKFLIYEVIVSSVWKLSIYNIKIYLLKLY